MLTRQKISALFLSVLLMAAPVMPSKAQAPAHQPELINTLDYFISKHLDKGLGGSHNQNQVIRGSTSYYVKWQSNAFEIHTWDDQNIYLTEDHSWKKTQAYSFQPGIWMKRTMQVGESIDQQANWGLYFNIPACGIADVHPLPYTMTLEAHVPEYNMGGDLGAQDVIVLKYDYSNAANPGNFERFYYSHEWGWVKWELYQQDSLVKTSSFNIIHDHPLAPEIASSCTARKSGGLKILTSQAVRIAGTDSLYYINGQAQRQYLCPASLINYDVQPALLPVISQQELNNYPEAVYVKITSSRQVYNRSGQYKFLLSMAKRRGVKLSPSEMPQTQATYMYFYKIR